MSSPADILGHRIRDARKDAGLSQIAFSGHIGVEKVMAEICCSYIERWAAAVSKQRLYY